MASASRSDAAHRQLHEERRRAVDATGQHRGELAGQVVDDLPDEVEPAVPGVRHHGDRLDLQAHGSRPGPRSVDRVVGPAQVTGRARHRRRPASTSPRASTISARTPRSEGRARRTGRRRHRSWRASASHRSASSRSPVCRLASASAHRMPDRVGPRARARSISRSAVVRCRRASSPRPAAGTARRSGSGRAIRSHELGPVLETVERAPGGPQRAVQVVRVLRRRSWRSGAGDAGQQRLVAVAQRRAGSPGRAPGSPASSTVAIAPEQVCPAGPAAAGAARPATAPRAGPWTMNVVAAHSGAAVRVASTRSGAGRKCDSSQLGVLGQRGERGCSCDSIGPQAAEDGGDRRDRRAVASGQAEPQRLDEVVLLGPDPLQRRVRVGAEQRRRGAPRRSPGPRRGTASVTAVGLPGLRPPGRAELAYGLQHPEARAGRRCRPP